MIKSKLSISVLVILVAGSLVIGFAPTQTAAQGSLDADVQAGDTYYYDVTSFPSFQDLIEVFQIDDSFDENNSVTFSGGLEDSQIYVKVMDTNQEEATYWDGSQEVTGQVPTVDISTGLITGQQITMDGVIEGEPVSVTLPAGIAVPIPTLFGTATMLNVSSFDSYSVMPLPLVLSDAFSMHETIVTQANSELSSSGSGGSVSVTNDNSQFRIDATDIELDTDILLNGFISWKKPSGLAQELNFDITNTTSSTTLIDIDIDLASEEYKPLGVEVGDTFELTVSDAGFDSTVTGFSPEERAEIQDDLAQVNGNMTERIGDVLVEFEVVEVDGLYYSVEGSVQDPDDPNSRVGFPTAADDGFEDLWFAGFGRLGPGMVQPTSDPGQTFVYDYSTNTYTSDRIPTRERAMPGPFMTGDYKIYQAWDNSFSAAVASIDAEVTNLLAIADNNNTNLELTSTSGGDPSVNLGFTSDSSASSYGGWTLTGDIDLRIWENGTYYNGSHYVEETTTVDIVGNAEVAMNYDNSIMTSFSISGNLDLDMTYENETVTQTGGVEITNFIIELTAETTVDPAAPDGSGTDGTDDTSAGLPLPGFEIVATIVSIVGLTTIVRLRSNKR